jgi:N-acetylmuramoyl-L-alanine amidase
MKYKETFQQSPNVSSRAIKPEGIVLHHSAGSFKGSVSWCSQSKSQVSYHCIVDLDGTRVNLALPTQRAWHAGESSYKGRKDCNSFMVGIAVSGDTTKRELTQQEVESVAEWCVNIMKKYSIAITAITTHREISPKRKNDVDLRAEKAIIDEIKKVLNIDC